MTAALHSVHVHPRDASGHGFATVEDRFRPFALLLPFVWAFANGWWITGISLALAFAAVLAALPVAGAQVAWYGVMLIAGLEGGSLIRLELRLRGWKEAGLVEAATEDGAAELWLEGKGLRTGT